MKTTFLALALAALAVGGASALQFGMTRGAHRVVSRERVGRTIVVPDEDNFRGVEAALVATQGEEATYGRARAAPLASNSGGTAGLYGGIVEMGQYFVNVTIGGQKFIVQLDTGSSTLAVPVDGCVEYNTTTGQPDGVPCNFVDAAFKPTPNTKPLQCGGDEQCSFLVEYLDGSGMKGNFFTDEIVLGGLSTGVGAPFGGINSTSHDFESSTDGILGAAYKSIDCFREGPSGATKCFPTVVDSLISAGAMQNVFGICLDDAHGRWDLGELDPQYHDHDYMWAPLDSSEGFYEITLGGLRVGSTTIPASSQGKSIVVDSGTTLAALPTEAFKAITDEIERAEPPHYAKLLSGSGVQLDESEINQWPTLEYDLPGDAGAASFTLDLPPQAYLVDVGQGTYFFALQGAETGGQHILGDIFMQQFYVAFDREGGRVGFTRVRDCERV